MFACLRTSETFDEMLPVAYSLTLALPLSHPAQSLISRQPALRCHPPVAAGLTCCSGFPGRGFRVRRPPGAIHLLPVVRSVQVAPLDCDNTPLNRGAVWRDAAFCAQFDSDAIFVTTATISTFGCCPPGAAALQVLLPSRCHPPVAISRTGCLAPNTPAPITPPRTTPA
jgi:hypothetical protein